MQTTLSLFNTNLELCRYPLQKNEKHQAWDAADEYLIEHLENLNLDSNSHVLIFNDNFGALSCFAALKGFRVSCVNDSLLSQQNIKKNLQANKVNHEITFLSSTDELPSNIDVALLRLPKSNRLLVWQLSQLAFLNKNDFIFIAGAKAKDIHSSTLALFEKHLGTTKTSLAKKKARLIFTKKEKQLAQLSIPITEFTVPEYDLTIRNYPNVFSAEKLDIAAYLMLQHIPESASYENVIDLGCGNGVLAIEAAKKNPNAQLTVVDESYMAVASAKMNLLDHGIKEEKIITSVNNCLKGFASNSHELILCNPPFHQQHTITDHIAWQMFCDAKRVLKPQGELIIIGNRHLGYHSKITRLFGNAEVIASNAKFTVIKAIKS